ncbi:unnamed protein product, partial [Mesorhabditis belari]|uniref:SSD domain-containing protein n=1 Tax=Mesorhabditis belari TaxID=2138241 RepID=A0AAF3F4U4_9BILA
MKDQEGRCQKETIFVQGIQGFFSKVGDAVCYAPWTFIIVSTAFSCALSAIIPFREMENNISDFTPYQARSRQELQIYESFFSDRGEPKVVYAFIRPKDGENLLTIEALNQTIQVMDKINYDFYLKTSKGKENYQEFCRGFCLINEPVRNFAKGFFLNNGSLSGSSHVDLGYPVTVVLGRKLYMDPNFFGVKIAIPSKNSEKEEIVEVAEATKDINNSPQISNNIRHLGLIVLQFRAEIGDEIDPEALKEYEMEIARYFHKVEYSSISVHVLTDNLITTEIVRAGLTLLPFLGIGFLIMTIFTTTTFWISARSLGQWNKYKILIALTACILPFMACGTTMGAMFLFGFRFGSILCVTPFLVLAISVDDGFLVMNSWQRICHHRRKHNAKREDIDEDLRSRMREMLIETGPSVTITSLTNALAFGIGALTPTPEIQLFSIGNALAVTFDYIYQLTIFTALMAVVGRWELENERKSLKFVDYETQHSTSESSSSTTGTKKIVKVYCKVLTDRYTIMSLIFLLAVYWYISISGTLKIKPELDPQRLFLEKSDMQFIFNARKVFIAPNYATCWVLINNPGDIRNSTNRRKLRELVDEFEALPSALGKYSTKFFLRDYEEFLQQADEAEFEEESMALKTQDDLGKFLAWPEFSFWKGFLQTANSSNGLVIDRFFFITAFHGAELVDWSKRAELLNVWRGVADRHPSLNITVYEDDARFLDLIETMIPTTWQSALLTLICMFFVTLLFISDPPTLFVATFSILSTCVGVFGLVSWWGADLDPILMSATVMSIGFAVDIPAHISYHYFQTSKQFPSVIHRLEHTISAVGFPILQASVSTILCVLSLFLVDLHMSQTFAKTLFLVVFLGAIHGLIVMPVLFNLISWVPRRKGKVFIAEENNTTIATRHIS